MPAMRPRRVDGSVIAVIIFAVATAPAAIQQTPTPLTDPDAYAVYAAALSSRWATVSNDVLLLQQETESPGEAEAIAHLREMPASKVESGLPDLKFGEWITRLVGWDLRWELNDCGEGPRPEDSVPLCVGIERATPHLSLLVAVGNSVTGIIDPPVLFFGDIELSDMDRDVKRLADLPLLLAEDEARRAKHDSSTLRVLTQNEAEQAGRLASAQQIDPQLSAEPFEAWLARSATRDIAWILEGCSGVNTQPECVTARVTWPDGSSALVTLDLELVQRGVSDVPTFKSAELYDRGRQSIDYFASLYELAAAIQSMRDRLLQPAR